MNCQPVPLKTTPPQNATLRHLLEILKVKSEEIPDFGKFGVVNGGSDLGFGRVCTFVSNGGLDGTLTTAESNFFLYSSPGLAKKTKYPAYQVWTKKDDFRIFVQDGDSLLPIKPSLVANINLIRAGIAHSDLALWTHIKSPSYSPPSSFGRLNYEDHILSFGNLSPIISGEHVIGFQFTKNGTTLSWLASYGFSMAVKHSGQDTFTNLIDTQDAAFLSGVMGVNY